MNTERDFERENGRSERDERGRFRKGKSGNPEGRPRKPLPEPWSLQGSLTAALSEVVPVTGPDGAVEHLTIRDVLIRSFVRNTAKAKPRDQVVILERLHKLDALNPAPEPEVVDEVWLSEGDRQLMEIANRWLEENDCCQCERPIRKDGGSQTR